MSFLFGFLHRQLFIEPPRPTISFSGRVVIITGSNVGLGLEASRWITCLGASRVILACRNIEKGKAAALSIRNSTSCPPESIDVWQLDMSSYASILSFAEKANSLPRLDALIANAGINTFKFSILEDNEATITTNVVSTALLALLLHPKLCQTAKTHGRHTHLTITASDMHQVARFKESKAPYGQIFSTLNDAKKANMGDRYNVSKFLDIIITKKIAESSPATDSQVIVNCVNPGMCRSSLVREFEGIATRIALKLLGRTTEQGARTLVHAASAGPESHGQYLSECVIATPGGLFKGRDAEELQSRFWSELKKKLEAIQPDITKTLQHNYLRHT